MEVLFPLQKHGANHRRINKTYEKARILYTS